MRLRYKIAMVIGFLCLALLVVFVFIIPALPTGYRQMEAEQSATVRRLERESAARAVPLPAVAPGAAVTTETVPTSRTQPKAETPREAFNRCWSALQRVDDPRVSAATTETQRRREVIGRMVTFMNQRSGRNSMVARVSSGDLDELPPDVAQAEQVVRAHLAEPMRLTAAHLAGQDLQPWQTYAIEKEVKGTDLATEVADLPPAPEVAELFRLPEGAVPPLPARNGASQYEWEQAEALTQAFLYTLVNGRDLDAGAVTRRLFDLFDLLRLGIYPNHVMSDGLPGDLFILAAMNDRIDHAALAAISRELLQLDSEARDPNSPRQLLARRHRAMVARGLLVGELDRLRGGAEINNNTLNFILGGKPARLWFGALSGQLRRQIDLMAVALAGDDEHKLVEASKELFGTLHLANVNLDFWTRQVQNMMTRLEEQRHYRETALELALWSWRRDHGRLPDRLADLFPDYLPESARHDLLDGQVWLIQETPTHPVLWRVGYRPYTARERQMFAATDFNIVLKLRIKTVEQERGRPLNAEERKKLEEARATYERFRTRRGFIATSGMVLF